MHGFALNVGGDLSPFDNIVPCGICRRQDDFDPEGTGEPQSDRGNRRQAGKLCAVRAGPVLLPKRYPWPESLACPHSLALLRLKSEWNPLEDDLVTHRQSAARPGVFLIVNWPSVPVQRGTGAEVARWQVRRQKHQGCRAAAWCSNAEALQKLAAGKWRPEIPELAACATSNTNYGNMTVTPITIFLHLFAQRIAWSDWTAACPRNCRCRTASSATFSPDGARFVYMPMSQDFRNWKRYRGGWAPDLWLFDLKTFAARNITNNPANDAQPMWHGNTIYFLSDRGASQRNNIWAEDLGTGAVAPGHAVPRLRHHVPVDRSRRDRVSQAGGRLYLLNLATEKAAEVPIRVVTDATTLRPRTAKADKLVDVAVGVADRQARRLRGARRHRHRAGRARRGGQRDAQLRRGRSLSALVARRQDGRLLERPQRRVRADAARRPKAPAPSAR